MFLVSFDDISFSSLDVHGGINWSDARGQWRAQTRIQPRMGTYPVVTGADVSARTIPVQFVVDEGANAYDVIEALLGALRPNSGVPRRLVAQRGPLAALDPLLQVERYALVELDTAFGGFEPNVLPVRFISADPVWYDLYPSDLIAPYNPTFATDLTGWTSANTTVGLTVVVAHDTTVFYDDEATDEGSQSVEITANTAGINAFTDRFNTNYLPVVTGRTYVFRAAARRSTTNVTPQVFLVWYDAAQALLSLSAIESFTPAVNTWAVQRLVATAPANAAYVRVFDRVLIPGAGNLGKVWFDSHELLHGDDAIPTVEDATVPFTNAGQAVVHPVIRFIAGPGIDPAGGLGLLNRRTFTVTNSGSKGWKNVAIPIDLGDTTGWVWFGSGHNAVDDEFYIFKDGFQVRRTPVNLDTVQSYVWILVDELPAGASADYVIAYNGLLVDEPPLELTQQYRPAFDISWESNTATSGTATTITRTGAGWATSQWRHAFVEIISGTGAGANIYAVTASTADTLTVASWANGTPNSTSVYLVYMSGLDPVNTQLWMAYDTRQVERSDAERGLWGSSGTGQNQPQLIWFDNPGAWSLTNYRDNNDERTQPEVSRIIPPDDYFTIPNISRIWQGGRVYKDGGKFDAVEYKSPFELISWRFDAQWKNPNGMCGALFACREGAGADWEPIDKTAFPNVSASDTHALISPVTYALPDGTYHLMVVVVPRNDEEIPLTWYKDEGTATSATSTTMTDLMQDWEVDQWIGGRARIVSGTGTGNSVAITDSTATSITVASWPAGTPDGTSRYQLTNRKIESNLRAADQWRVIADASTIDVSAISAEDTNLLTAVSLRLDGGPDGATNEPPYERIDIGMGSRRLLLAGSEELRIDCRTGRITVHDSSSGELLRPLGGDFVRFMEVRADGSERRSTHRFPLTPGAHTIFTPTFAASPYMEALLMVEWVSGWWGG